MKKSPLLTSSKKSARIGTVSIPFPVLLKVKRKRNPNIRTKSTKNKNLNFRQKSAIIIIEDERGTKMLPSFRFQFLSLLSQARVSGRGNNTPEWRNWQHATDLKSVEVNSVLVPVQVRSPAPGV